MKVQFPTIFRPFFGKLTWRKDPSLKVIYLTFDDGPVPEATVKILDLLDEYQLKATFFCVGENVRKFPEIYNEVLLRGHKTGNHTYNHLKGITVSTKDYIENIQKASELIDSKLFRPPYGRITNNQKKLLQNDFEIIMWDVLTQDYDRNQTPEMILRNIKKYTRNGSIIVFHDSIKARNNVLTVLPPAIEFWKKEGYEFGKL
jgi:peptidoglycan/xylan/chitin deacetylase (PgdA/CDA1 family)